MAPKKRSKAAKAASGQDTAMSVKTKRAPKRLPHHPPESGECLLLDLPAELRNDVYQYAVTTSASFNISDGKLSNGTDALAQSCRQLRVEVLPVLKHYVKTDHRVFSVNIVDYDFDSLTSFLGKLNPLPDNSEAARVLNIVLHFTTHPETDGLVKWLQGLQMTPVLEGMRRTYEAKFHQPDSDVLREICYVFYGIRSLGIDHVSLRGQDFDLIWRAGNKALKLAREQAFRDEVKRLENLW